MNNSHKHKSFLLEYAGWLTISLVFVFCVASIWVHAYIGLNNDNVTLLYQTRRMLSGAVLYKDLFEIAPPFIHFLYTVPVFLSSWLHIPVKYTLDGYVTSLILLSMTGCGYLVWKRLGDVPNRALKTAFLLAPIGIAFSVYSFYAEVFSDREHIIVLLVLPFLFLHSPWLQTEKIGLSPLLRFAIGVMAGIACVLKPHYVVLPATLLLFEIVRKRSLLKVFTPENWGVAFSGALFLITIFFITPAYVENVLPVAFETYKAALPTFQNRLYHLEREYFPYVPAFIVFFSAFALIAGFRQNIANILYMATVLGATSVIYAINSGWFYTIYPLYALSFIMLCYTLYMVFTTPFPRIQVSIGVQRAALSIVCVVFLLPAWTHYTGKDLFKYVNQQLERQQRTGYPKNYTRLRPQVRDVFEKYLEKDGDFALYGSRTWATNMLQVSDEAINRSRFDALWQLPGLMRKEDKAHEVEFTRKFMVKAMSEDLKRNKTPVVIVEEGPKMRKLPAYFDIVTYFQQYPEFKEEWSNYRRAESINICSEKRTVRCAYGIYVRKDDSPFMVTEDKHPGSTVVD